MGISTEGAGQQILQTFKKQNNVSYTYFLKIIHSITTQNKKILIIILFFFFIIINSYIYYYYYIFNQDDFFTPTHH